MRPLLRVASVLMKDETAADNVKLTVLRSKAESVEPGLTVVDRKLETSPQSSAATSTMISIDSRGLDTRHSSWTHFRDEASTFSQDAY